jgi:hypothetical protein
MGLAGMATGRIGFDFIEFVTASLSSCDVREDMIESMLKLLTVDFG